MPVKGIYINGQKSIVHINPSREKQFTLYTGNVFWNVRNAFCVFASRDITWFKGGWIKTKALAFIYELGKGQKLTD